MKSDWEDMRVLVIGSRRLRNDLATVIKADLAARATWVKMESPEDSLAAVISLYREDSPLIVTTPQDAPKTHRCLFDIVIEITS